MKTINWKKGIPTVIVYILFVLGMCIAISQKCNLHVDGFYTYGLSNQPYTDYIGMAPTEGETYKPAEKAWLDYLTVRQDARFDYANVWKNQAEDVHPPLYYALVHTICSLFPESFSIWYAGVVNILFGCLTLFMARKLVRELVGEDSTGLFLFSAAFALSPGMLSASSFLRMYVMAMFFVTLITWLFLKIFKEGITAKRLLAVFFTCLTGTLTHYYFIVYLFFLCAVTGIFLLARKCFRELLSLAGTVGLGLLGAVALFPGLLYHILLESGDRGEESVQKLKYTDISEYVQKMKDYFGYLNDQLMGGLFPVVLLAVLTALIFLMIQRKAGGAEKCPPDSRLSSWMLLLLPCICYYVLISRISVYTADRYIQPVYGVVLVLGIGGLLAALRRLIPLDKSCLAVSCGILLVMTLNGFRLCPWEYLYRQDGEVLETIAEYPATDCLYIYDEDEPSRIQQSYFEGRRFESITFVSDEHLNLIAELGFLEKDSLMLCVDYACDGEAVAADILADSETLMQSVCLGKYGFYTTTWYLGN